MAVQVFRVVVRGHFADLTEDQRAALLAEADDHTFHAVSYTEWGTFIYERNLVAFNFRYEVRVDAAEAGRDDGGDPAEVCLAKARASLEEWGLGHKHLRASATDMSRIWAT